MSTDFLDIVQNGLEPIADKSPKVIVVGAGMAGLSAAYELKRAGYEVTILEAQKRVGGRIQTLREPFDDGMYGEVGAMRLPRAHKLTMNYVDKFDLETIPFHITTENNFYYFDGKRYFKRDVEQDPSILGLNLTANNGKSVFELWGEFIAEATQRMQTDSMGYWKELIHDYGDVSFYDFLKKSFGSTDTVTDFALLGVLEPTLHASFLSMLQVAIEFEGTDLCQIIGGMDNLPKAFLSYLEENIQYGAEVIALDYADDSATIHFRDDTGKKQISGDFAIITIPFAVLRFVDILTPFSIGKQRAIRQLRYSEVVKVLLQFKNRFWETEDNIFGGNTATDLPNRQIYYPERTHASKRGVLIGTYTYTGEGAHWASMPDEDRVTQSLKCVSKIHPQARAEFETGISKVWGQDKFASGLALYYPDEHERIFPHTRTPEGAIHFAGEHTSYKHGWIEGAVESGIRAASEIHEQVKQS